MRKILLFILFLSAMTVNVYAALTVTPIQDFVDPSSSPSVSYAITQQLFTFTQASDMNSSLSTDGYTYTVIDYSSLSKAQKDLLKSNFGSYSYALDKNGLVDLQTETVCKNNPNFPSQYWNCNTVLKSKTATYRFLLSMVSTNNSTSVPSILPGFKPTDQICVSDLNNDGVLEANEIKLCLNGTTSTSSSAYLCPFNDQLCQLTQSTPICPAGTALNLTTHKCEVTPTSISCPSGYTYDKGLDRCVVAPVCDNGGILNTTTDQCEIVISSSSCPSGYSYNSTIKMCVKSPDCPNNGVYDVSLDKCVLTVLKTCPSGYAYNSSRNLCTKALSCPSGSSYSSTAKKCIKTVIKSCPSGYTLSGSTCLKSPPTCPNGMNYNRSTNRCEKAASGGGSGHGSCRASTGYGGNGISEVNSYSEGMHGFQISNGNIRAIGVLPSLVTQYGNWVSLSGNGQSFVSFGILFFGTFSDIGSYTIIINNGKIRSDYIDSVTHYSYNTSWLSLSNGGTVWDQDHLYNGLQISNGKIRILGQNADAQNNSYVVYGAWVPFTATDYTCSLNGHNYGTNYSTCYNSCTYRHPYYCTVGTLSGPTCIANATCPYGGHLNTSTDKCQLNVTLSCPSGFSYDSSISVCIANPICSNGGVLDTVTDECEISVTDTCPAASYTYDSANNTCVSGAICGYGSLNTTRNECELSAATLCPSDYTFNATNNSCKKAPVCASPSVYSTTVNQCVTDADHTCPTDTSYSTISRTCEAYPICPNGIFQSTTNQCNDGNNTCPLGSQYSCVKSPIDGKNYCSNISCNSASTAQTNTDTTQGANDKKNNGTVNAAGECLGQIYIFNGNDKRCRAVSIDTLGTNFCVKGKSILGLLKANPTEKLLAKLREWHKLDGSTGQGNGQCHYVGEYCASKFLGMCVKKKKTYCCFGSPLARIIQEQGRVQPQINLSWGTPKSPNCEGFTPSQFQKIDFTKINFKAYFANILNVQSPASNNKIQSGASEAVTKFKQSLNKQ